MSSARLPIRVVACVLLALVAQPHAVAASPNEIVLRFSHFLGPQSFFETDLVGPWSRELERRTGGRVRVHVLNAADPTGDVRLQSTHVRNGVVDIALGLRGAEGDASFPGSSIVELPGIVRSGECGAMLLWSLHEAGGIGAEYAGFKVLALFTQNPALLHTRSRPVADPADLEGLRIRASSEFVVMALETLRAQPRRLNRPEEIAAQLVAGELDGVVTNWGNPIPGFDSIVRYHTNVAVSAPAFFILMNEARYSALPQDVRATIDAMSGAAWSRKIGLFWNDWDRAVRERALARERRMIDPDAKAARRWRAALSVPSRMHLAQISPKFPRAKELHRRLLRDSSRIGCRADRP